MEREQSTLRLPVELHDVIKREANKRGVSVNALILKLLSEARTRQEK